MTGHTKRRLTARAQRRKGERGAALIMVLLIAAMMLAVCGTLVMSTGNSLNSTLDATTEARAYYAADAGLQATLNVLRGNVAPNPLFAAIPTGSPVPAADRLNFRGAVTRSISNLTTDPATQADGSAYPMRLSRWLPYDATYTDRVALTSPYNPMSGDAYSIEVTEPDNSQTVSYSTAATFTGGGSSYSFGTASISFTPASNTVTAASPTSVTLGTLVVTTTGGTSTVPNNTQVNIRLKQSLPWDGSVVLGGTLSGKVDNTGPNLKLTFNSDSARASGTLFSLASNPFIMNSSSGSSSGNTTTYTVSATLTAPDPRRLKIKSTGYGPRGARKVLEMYVQRNKYYLDPPAPIVIRGADDTTQTMTFDLGSSNAKKYSGRDFSNVQTKLPTVAIRLQDWTKGFGGVTKGSTVDNPKFSILDLDSIPSTWPTTLTPLPSLSPNPATGLPPPWPMYSGTPDFLQTATAARTFLNDMETTARTKNRYYTSFSGMAGTTTSPKFTFVDGNCTLDGGAGLLIVTGNLYFNGNDDFKGVILALGNGHVERNGSGNGRVLGSWMVASFARTGTGNFTAPYFDVSGGGNGSFYYDTTSIDRANLTVAVIATSFAER